MTALALALDTSTPVLSCALVERDATGMRVLATRSAGPPAVVSTVVPSLFDELLSEAQRSMDEVAVALAGLGPGLFTGARVALATMKAVAYARRIPLVGAGSLEAMALAAARRASLRAGDELPFDAPLESDWLCPILDARKGEVYFAVHRFRTGALETRVAPTAASPSEVLRLLATDEARPQPVGAGTKVVGSGFGEREPSYPGAAEIAFLALHQEREPVFELARVLSLEPRYLRPPEAEVARQKRAQSITQR